MEKKWHAILYKFYLVSCFIGLILILAAMIIYLVRFQTLTIPFFDMSPVIPVSLLVIYVRWFFDIASYAKGKI